MRIVLVVVMLAGLAAHQPARGAVAVRFAAGTSTRSIPFDLLGNRILLRVGINGSSAATFILDTGANVNVVSLRSAKAAGIALVPWTGGSVGIGARPPELQLVTDALTFNLPDLAVSDSRVFAMALEEAQDCLALAARESGGVPPAIDGFLGAPFFRSLVVQIDYRARQLHLYDPKGYTYRGRGRSLPIELDDLYTYVDVRVGAPGGRDAHAKLVVDTGAGALSLTRQFAAVHGILPSPDTLTSGAECGSAGRSSDPTLIGRLDRLRIGPFTLRRPVTVFYQASSDRTYDGLLGGDALQHFTVIFDYSRRRMILEPTRKAGS